MKFSYQVGMCDPDHYRPLACAAEEAGFDGLAVPDSICYPQEASSKYPYNKDGSREFLERLLSPARAKQQPPQNKPAEEVVARAGHRPASPQPDDLMRGVDHLPGQLNRARQVVRGLRANGCVPQAALAGLDVFRRDGDRQHLGDGRAIA